jgi:hypothetical protein
VGWYALPVCCPCELNPCADRHCLYLFEVSWVVFCYRLFFIGFYSRFFGGCLRLSWLFAGLFSLEVVSFKQG